MEKFEFLSKAEEEKLTLEEKRIYYENLREYIKQRKLTNITPGATTIATKLPKFNSICCSLITKMYTAKGFQHIVTGQENIVQDTGAIYAHTHSGILDTFIWEKTIPNTKCVVLHASGLKKVFLMLQYSVGLVLVDKTDKSSQRNAKYDMMKLINDGYKVIYFPEGAWNLTPSKLHLPMWRGFLDIAQKTGCPVIPVVSEYEYDTSGKKAKITGLRTHYCDPFYVSPTDDLDEMLEKYKEIISTKRWELIEEKGIYKREELSDEDYIKIIEMAKRQFRTSGIDIDFERDHLFGADNEEYVFQHINDIPYEGNELQPTEEVKRLIKINKEHNI